MGERHHIYNNTLSVLSQPVAYTIQCDILRNIILAEASYIGADQVIWLGHI